MARQYQNFLAFLARTCIGLSQLMMAASSAAKVWHDLYHVGNLTLGVKCHKLTLRDMGMPQNPWLTLRMEGHQIFRQTLKKGAIWVTSWLCGREIVSYMRDGRNQACHMRGRESRHLIRERGARNVEGPSNRGEKQCMGGEGRQNSWDAGNGASKGR